MKTISIIADFAGILGLFVSFFVLYEVNKIKLFYAGKVRRPSLLLEINESLSNLINYKDLKHQNEIKIELIKLQSCLKSLSKFVDQESKDEIERIDNILEHSCKETVVVTQRKVDDIYRGCQKVVFNLSNNEKDRNVIGD